MLRNLLGLLLFFTASLGVVFLTFRSSVTDTPADFVFVNGTEPKSLDPAILTGQPEGRIADALFEGLTYLDPRSLQPVPGAASSWEMSDDGRTYTFHIREDALWSDGTPVTADDFAWSWRRLQEPGMASEYAYALHMVRWAEIFNTYEAGFRTLIGPREGARPVVAQLEALLEAHPEGLTEAAWGAFVSEHALNEALKGVEDPVLQRALSWRGPGPKGEDLRAIGLAMAREGERRRRLWHQADERFGRTEGVFATDEKTLVVELKALTPYFLAMTAFYPTFPVPRHVVEVPENETDWFLPDKIVSNGPFRLEAWRVNDKIRLVKSETYWGRETIRLDVIDALPIENTSTALNLYLRGNVDWIDNYPGDLVDALKGRDDFRSNEGLMVYFFRFNTRREALKDPRVRRAISMAVNRQEIIDHILKLGQRPARTFVPPGMEGYDPPDSSIAYDPAAARALLAEAGFPGGRGLPTLGLLFNTQDTNRKIAESVAYQLHQNLGLDIQAFNKEWQAYQQTVRDGDYDIARASWIADYQDPNTFLDMWVTNGGNNKTGFSSPLYDRLIAFAADVDRFIEAPDAWVPRLKEKVRMRAMLSEHTSLSPGPARVRVAGRIRMQLFREAEAILVQDAFAVMPLYFYVVDGLVKPWVRGYHTVLELLDGTTVPNLRDIHPLRGLWIDASLKRGSS